MNGYFAGSLAKCCWLCPMVAGACAAIGCRGPRVTRVELTAYDETGAAQHYCTEFARASYRRSAGGMVELVLRAENPSERDPTQTITQIVYVKELWNPQPGTTYAEPSQINARVQYALLAPPAGVRYDGAAFFTYKISKRTGVLTGRLESGNIAPRYRMGEAFEPFGPSSFTGTVRAVENAADVVNAIQMLESLFSKRSAKR